MTFKLLSTRYSDRGINTISDIVIWKAKTHFIKDVKPKIYHIRLDYNHEKSAFDNILHFLNNVLPHIKLQFVAIVTGEDLTCPNQVDVRWNYKEVKQLMRIFHDNIVNNKYCIHFYIENRDEVHEKTSSLPLGLNPREFPNGNIDILLQHMDYGQQKRELKAVCIHRMRAGDREHIENIKHNWKDCIIDNGDYTHESWWNLLKTTEFVICAHGGGRDPCPKVWEALCLGCIPIIKHSVMDDAYYNFPIVFVDNWDVDTINTDNLKKWNEDYRIFYENPIYREIWVHKLYLKHWSTKILSHFK